MTQRSALWIALLSVVFALALPAAATAVPLDGATAALPASPATVPVAESASAVYRVDLEMGEVLNLHLVPSTGAPATLDLDLFVYGPSASATDHGAALAASRQSVTLAETISLSAAQTGTYYVEVYAYENGGEGVLTWSVAPEPLLPVYRFYNARTGTHFYTPDEQEKSTIIATMGGVFSFEGVAYSTKASRNDQFLYRFFNKRTGTHFYTADESEKARIAGTLGYLYSYDGPTFKVSLGASGGKAPVYRFYNARSGTHFYTADESERQRVQGTLGSLYTFEGVAFYLGQ